MKRLTRRGPVSIETMLDRQVSALDELVGEVRAGVRGQAHYDALADRAEAIGEGLRAAFRGSRKEAA